MKIIEKGAEADLILKNGLLIKKRISKKYRNKELDFKIRKERTKIESSLIRKARTLGINTPKIFETDLKKMKISMEYLKGKRLKDELNEKNLNYCFEAGKFIGLMHSGGLIHGDLTTSNIIVLNKKLYFIDFGLGFHSKKNEDFAVDLLNFKKTFMATHSEFKKGWQKLVKGYNENFGKSKHVLEQLEKIEKRGRYL